MRLLLDTHALVWWLTDDISLSSTARRLVGMPSNSVLVSSASAWEIATKVRLGKLPGAEELAGDFVAFLVREKFEQLPITAEHGIRAGLLPGPHRDPFDRMLAAQCLAENVPIVSRDRIFDDYRVRRFW
jgi:PIN domain nuclease of toxin-antitoxin system